MDRRSQRRGLPARWSPAAVRVCIAMILCLGTLARPAFGQQISVEAEAASHRLPDILRLSYQLTAADAHLETAIEKHRQQQRRIVERLLELGAAPDSVSVSELTATFARKLDGSKNLIGLGRGERTSEEVVVAADLEADWSIAAEGQAALLLRSGYLVKRISAALAEEDVGVLFASARQGGASSEVGRSPVRWLYCRKPSHQERLDVITQAFRQARSRAALIAKANDQVLGGPVQLELRVVAPTSRSGEAGDTADPLSIKSVPARTVPESPDWEAPDDELVGDQPVSLPFRVHVRAEYSATSATDSPLGSPVLR